MYFFFRTKEIFWFWTTRQVTRRLLTKIESFASHFYTGSMRFFAASQGARSFADITVHKFPIGWLDHIFIHLNTYISMYQSQPCRYWNLIFKLKRMFLKKFPRGESRHCLTTHFNAFKQSSQSWTQSLCTTLLITMIMKATLMLCFGLSFFFERTMHILTVSRR